MPTRRFFAVICLSALAFALPATANADSGNTPIPTKVCATCW